MFKARNKPFVLVFWSRDPDGSQHNTGDSLNTMTPGINGPTSMAGIKNADDNLAQLRKALDDLGLAASTNIIVSSDHGFSTISKESKTSPSAKAPMTTRRRTSCRWASSRSISPRRWTCRCSIRTTRMRGSPTTPIPRPATACSGKDPAKPDLVVATNGGSDLIYLPNKDKKLAGRTVKALLEQDYVSGLFVDDDLGRFPGTLPMSQLDLKGKAVTPNPAIVVNFRSWSSGCDEPTNCSVEVADTVLRQGQGMHGSFSRGDTMNFMAAIGPDFKAGYVDALPVSNADVGATAAQLLGLTQKPKGGLIGRVMSEAMPNGATPGGSSGSVRSKRVGERPADGAEIPARAVPALFRRRRIPGPHARARGRRRQTENGGEITRRPGICAGGLLV